MRPHYIAPGAWIGRDGAKRVVVGTNLNGVTLRKGTAFSSVSRSAWFAWVRRHKARHCAEGLIDTTDGNRTVQPNTTPCDRCGEPLSSHGSVMAR